MTRKRLLPLSLIVVVLAILAASADEPPKKPYDPDGPAMQPGHRPTGAKPPPGSGVPPAPIRIRVTAITVRLLTVPDHDDAMLQIDATGELPGPGWCDAELVSRRGGRMAPDGYREFDLIAIPVPRGIRPIVPCPVKAKAAFLVPVGIKGVRVYQPETFVEEPVK
jgi:hypothetical protein